MRRALIVALALAVMAGCGSTHRTAKHMTYGTIPNAIPMSQKGAPNGVATLSAASKLTEGQIPPSVVLKAENLKDLASAATARTNLGLGSAATEPSSAFDAKGAAATAQAAAEAASEPKGAVATEKTRAETAESGKLSKAENLKDLISASTARTNLGLGTAAVEATTAFDAKGLAASEAKAEKERAEAAEALRAPLASPTFTGTPVAPTATAKTNTTQLATTAFTQTARGEAEAASIPLVQKGAHSGVAELNSTGFLLAGEIPANVLLTTSEQAIPAWAPSTLYAKGAEVIHEHVLYWAKAEHTSGSTFTAENWERGLAITEKGATNGVAELDGKGLLPEVELPTSAVVAKEKALGEVEGTVTLNLEEGSTFTATLKKNVTFKVTKASARPSEVTLILTENATGGWTWSVEGAAWVNSEPVFSTTKGTKNFESLVVNKSGGEIIALAGTEGKEGKTGPEGPRGPEGTAGATIKLLLPYAAKGTPVAIGEVAIGEANLAVCSRTAPAYKAGILKELDLFGGATKNGETVVAIFDLGKTTTEKWTVLWESTKTEIATSTWTVYKPELTVASGEELMICVMNSGTTQKYGEAVAAPGVAATQEIPIALLPVPGKVAAKIVARHKYGATSFGAAGASLTEAEMASTANATLSLMTIGRIE